jgi:hypothetical protein
MKKTIGRCENISLVDLGLDSKAKIDTGAYSTVIHVDGVKVVDNKLQFWIGDKTNKFIFYDYKKITVRSSFGKKQKRYKVLTRLKVGSKVYKIYVSLTDRKKMKYPILIGRRFLHKFGYIVDVTKKNIYDTTKKV